MIDTFTLLLRGEVGMMLGIIFGLLILATLTVVFMQKKRGKSYGELMQRINSWWVMVVLFIMGALLDKTIAMIFFGLLSYLALKEYFSLIPTRLTDRRIIFYAYLSIIAQYFFAGIEWYGMFIIWIPVYIFLLLPFRQVLTGETSGFLENTSRVQWGLMMFVFGLSHIAYLITLPSIEGHLIAGVELTLYLVFLTQFNDVLQYVWGKSFGKRKIVPQVSPNKTVEGFLGALVTTTLLAVLLSFLTPFTVIESVIAGLIIAIGGFIGDVVISMIKRDIGVKDSSSLIPGHGGILDRVDSLTYTAPLFFHYVYYLYY